MSYFTVSIAYLNPEYFDGACARRTCNFRVRVYADDKESARRIGVRAFQREHIGDFLSVRVQQVR